MTKKEQKKRRLRAGRARLLKDIREARAILRSLGASGAMTKVCAKKNENKKEKTK